MMNMMNMMMMMMMMMIILLWIIQQQTYSMTMKLEFLSNKMSVCPYVMEKMQDGKTWERESCGYICVFTSTG